MYPEWPSFQVIPYKNMPLLIKKETFFLLHSIFIKQFSLPLWLYLLLVKNLGRPTQQFHHMGSSPLPLLQIHRPIHTCGELRCPLYLKLCPRPPLCSLSISTTVNVNLYFCVCKSMWFSYVNQNQCPLIAAHGTTLWDATTTLCDVSTWNSICPSLYTSCMHFYA